MVVKKLTLLYFFFLSSFLYSQGYLGKKYSIELSGMFHPMIEGIDQLPVPPNKFYYSSRISLSRTFGLSNSFHISFGKKEVETSKMDNETFRDYNFKGYDIVLKYRRFAFNKMGKAAPLGFYYGFNLHLPNFENLSPTEEIPIVNYKAPHLGFEIGNNVIFFGFLKLNYGGALAFSTKIIPPYSDAQSFYTLSQVFNLYISTGYIFKGPI